MFDDQFRPYLLIDGVKRYVYFDGEEMPEEVKAEHDAWWAQEVANHEAFMERIAHETSSMIIRMMSQ